MLLRNSADIENLESARKTANMGIDWQLRTHLENICEKYIMKTWMAGYCASSKECSDQS